MALPLLFSFLGGGLAKAGVLGAAGSFLANPLIASAVGSGLGTLAETGDPKKALLGGLGSFAGGSLMGNIMGGAGGAGGQAVSTNAISGPMAQSPIPPVRPEGLGQAAASAAPGARGIFDAGMDFAKSSQGMGSAVGGMLPAMLPQKSETPEAKPTFRIAPMQREARMPGEDYQPGLSGEFDYGTGRPYSSEDFAERYAPQRRAMGGFVDNPYAQNYAAERGQMNAAMGFGEPSPTLPPAFPQQMPQLDMSPQMPQLGMSPQMPQLGMSPQMPQQQMGAPFASPNVMGLEPPMPMAQGGTVQRMVPGYGPVAMQGGGIAEMGAMPEPAAQPNEREVISGAIAAIMGQHPQPEAALGMFLQQYGEEALRDLVDRVQSGEFQDTQERFANGENGEVVGPGDGSGVDDMVPAIVDGQGDVLLSDGEFVLRKDATDALNGEFGPEFMDQMNSAGARAPKVVKQMAAA